jgi:predicted permease
MRTLRAWLHRTRLAGVRRRERELGQELESQLQLHIDHNIRAGMSPDEARRAAPVAFGPMEAIKGEYRDRATIPAIEAVFVDLRYALRMLRRRPALTVLTVGTLALGLGAAAAMFGVVDALMFRPPRQVHQPERLVEIEEIGNYFRYLEMRPRLRALDLAAFTSTTVSLGVGPDAVPLEVECVTTTYFPVLGTKPVRGRVFIADDEQPGREPGVMIGHNIWQRHFGGEQTALGRPVRIAGRTYTIIGVAPPGFTGVHRLKPAAAWILLARHPEACTFGSSDIYKSNGSWLNTLARIRDGFTWDQAQADAVAADINPETMQVGRADGTFETRRVSQPPQLERVRYSRGANAAHENRLVLWLAGGAFSLLLIACANVAGLLAMRAVERRREIAVRLQLGAGRSRVFAQLLMENVGIGGCCAVAAVGIAAWIGGLLRAFYPLADMEDVLNPRTATFLAIFALLAALVSGIIPAAQAARADIVSRLRTTNAAHERGRFRTVLLVLQVALSLMLIVGAGLFVSSVANFRRNFGYDLDRVIVGSVDLEQAGYRDARDIRARYDLLLERVRHLPEIEAAAYSSNAPVGLRSGTVTFIAPDINHLSGCCHAFVTVSPDYFATLGLQILYGRAFTEADAQSGGTGPVILDEGLAKLFFPNARDAIGRCLFIAFGTNTCREVVGVSESARQGSLRGSQLDSEFFVPFPKPSGDDAAPRVLLIRPRRGSPAALASITTAIRNAASDLPYVRIERLVDLANQEASSWRLGATVFGLFGVLAVVLSGVGIYAALAFSMRQRTAEIGVRMALGADGRNIAGLIFGHALMILAIGWLIGGLATAGLIRYIRSLLFDVASGDTSTFIAASLIIMAAALIGCIVPAIRASRIDPAVALRME